MTTKHSVANACLARYLMIRKQIDVRDGRCQSCPWVGSIHGLDWVGSSWVGLDRVALMFIFKVVIILQHKKCILLLYSPD